MSLEKLKTKLSKYGEIEVIKEGVVFTLFIRGNNFANQSVVSQIATDVLDYAESKYPNIEILKNDSDFLLLVLRS